MAHNYSTCRHCGACIKNAEICLCQVKNKTLAYGEENILEIPSGWGANIVGGKHDYKYKPHVHIQVDEDMIKNLVTEGRVELQLPNSVNVELKYTGTKIIDFQIHKVNVESVEDV